MRLSHLVPTAVALAALALAAPAGAQADDACRGADVVPEAGRVGATAKATLCLVNQQRTSRGLKALRAEPRLRKAAQRYAREMVRHAFFAHDSKVTGSTLESRVRAAGYLRGARSWRIGENLAWGSGELATPRSTVAGWMDSPGHRANILQPAFRQLGVGIAVGAPARGVSGPAATYVSDFGVRR